jgi:23S rRNA (pseudouridine1915-N3)-methyltransferase
LREVEVRGHHTEDDLIRREAALLAGACPDGAWRIALDAGGKALSSVEFAQLLGDRRDRGDRDIAFLIGGADGLDPGLVAGCAMAISFGRATWPHLLVRGMLAEQVYRAQQILSRHPYHHGK